MTGRSENEDAARAAEALIMDIDPHFWHRYPELTEQVIAVVAEALAARDAKLDRIRGILLNDGRAWHGRERQMLEEIEEVLS